MRIAVYRSIYILFTSTLFYSATAQNTLHLSADNRHYMEYKKKPVVLITSAEHYGALLNTDFNYTAYLDALHQEGMNNTRVFSGAYVESKTDIKWMQYNNTLAPKEGKLITPWERSEIPGYKNGGNKFDLARWDNRYFARLKDLLQQATNRGIMIELTFFGNQYGDNIYAYSPLYPDNNIQGIGVKREKGFLAFQSLEDTALVARQDAMLVKIVIELNSFDNLYYEISNEPYNEVKDSSVDDNWMTHMVELVRKTEDGLPKKHLIATNQSIVDNKQVDVANYHYVHISNIPSFDSLLRLNKVISMDETVGPLYDADVNDVRVEAWDFILHGGGAYNNLNWEYTPSVPKGTLPADTIRQYLQHLQQFISRFNFVKMKYMPGAVITPPKNAIIRVLAEEGKQYAVYIHHSKPFDLDPRDDQFVSKYEADTSFFRDAFTMALPAATYIMQWYNPKTGQQAGNPETMPHKGGNVFFTTPLFTTDIALKIIKK